jgi:ribosomal protein S19
MARSKWKFPFFKKRILRFTFTNLFSKIPKKLLIYERDSSIPHLFIQNSVYIHKGLGWTKVSISKFHITNKFGTFALTKKPYYFPIREKNSAKLIKR